MMTDLMDLEYN